MAERNALLDFMSQPGTNDARNRLAEIVANRASLFPAADYADGSTRWAVPGFALDIGAAWANMLGGDTSPQNALTVAGAAMAGSLPFAGRPTNAWNRWTAKAADNAAANAHIPPASKWNAAADVTSAPGPVDGLEEILKGMIGPPQSAKVYHGSTMPDVVTKHDPSRNYGFWTSTKPEIADSYTGIQPEYFNGMVAPGVATFERPLVVDAGGARYNQIPLQVPDVGKRHYSSDYLAMMARKIGADGMILRDVRDAATGGTVPSDVWHAVEKNTIRSLYSPDYIYSGGPGGAAANGILSLYHGQQPQRSD